MKLCACFCRPIELKVSVNDLHTPVHKLVYSCLIVMKLRTTFIPYRRRKPKVLTKEFTEDFALVGFRNSCVSLTLKDSNDTRISYLIPQEKKVHIVQRGHQGHYFYKICWCIAELQYCLYTNNVLLIFDLQRHTGNLEFSPLL